MCVCVCVCMCKWMCMCCMLHYESAHPPAHPLTYPPPQLLPLNSCTLCSAKFMGSGVLAYKYWYTVIYCVVYTLWKPWCNDVKDCISIYIIQQAFKLYNKWFAELAGFNNLEWSHAYIQKWNDWCFRPQFRTVRLYWAGDNLRKWDEYCYESCPWRRIDCLTCWAAA